MNKEIIEICKLHKIKNYTINPDGSIDVDGDVELGGNLYKLPLKFNRVDGNFYCYGKFLTSLEGAPNYVGGDFSCGNNDLTNLIGCPNYVGKDFLWRNNNLTSLEGAPNYVGKSFDISSNPLPKEVIDNPEAEIKRLNRNRKLNSLLND